MQRRRRANLTEAFLIDDVAGASRMTWQLMTWQGEKEARKRSKSARLQDRRHRLVRVISDIALRNCATCRRVSLREIVIKKMAAGADEDADADSATASAAAAAAASPGPAKVSSFLVRPTGVWYFPREDGSPADASSMHFNQQRRQRVECSSSVPAWLARSRDECVVRYDPVRYRLDVLVADVLGVRPSDLSRLHCLSLDECRWPLHPARDMSA